MQTFMPARFLRAMLTGVLLMLAVLACDLPTVIPTDIVPVAPPAQPETITPSVAAQPGGLTEIPMQVGYGPRGSFFEIYFTDPFDPEADKQEGGTDLPLVQSIDQARCPVVVAAYSISLI